MNFYLLDAAAAGLIIPFMIFFMIITIALEAVTMIILKYNKAGKAFLDSFLANLVSMGAGFIILFSDSDLFEITDNPIVGIGILYLITVVIEFLILYLLNRKLPVQKTLIAAIVINVVSYLLYYLIQFAF